MLWLCTWAAEGQPDQLGGDMMHNDMEDQLSGIETKIHNATLQDRLQYYPIVKKMVHGIKAQGQQVPLRLSRLNAALERDAFEDRFDNMPV